MSGDCWVAMSVAEMAVNLAALSAQNSVGLKGDPMAERSVALTAANSAVRSAAWRVEQMARMLAVLSVDN